MNWSGFLFLEPFLAIFCSHFLLSLSVCHLLWIHLHPVFCKLVGRHVSHGRVNPVPVVVRKRLKEYHLDLSCIPEFVRLDVFLFECLVERFYVSVLLRYAEMDVL